MLFEECFPFLHPKSLKSPPWGIGKGKERQREEEEEEEEGKGERKHRGEDRKALDGEDGKFGACGPIFNSRFQATDEQQGRKGWRAGEGPHWVTVLTCGSTKKEAMFTQKSSQEHARLLI